MQFYLLPALAALATFVVAAPNDILIKRNSCTPAEMQGYNPPPNSGLYVLEGSPCSSGHEGEVACSCNGGDQVQCQNGVWDLAQHCRLAGSMCVYDACN